MRSLHYAAIGDRVMQALEGRGIPSLPLKGYALAEAVHGNTGLRLFGDIDMLVPGKRCATRSGALRGSG